MGLSKAMHKHLLKSSALAAGLTLCCLSFSTQARNHLYGALDNPELLECEQLHWSGQLIGAEACYRGLQALSNPAEIRAEGMWALGDVQAANNLFQTALQESPDNANIRLRWGELFMQTYQYQEAYNLFAEALEIDPENAYAHIGAAQALSQGGNPEEVNAHIGTVMDNFFAPAGAQLRALIMMTRSAMEQDQYDKAREVLNQAQDLAADKALPTMELYALEAALAFMTRQDYQPFIDTALAESPNYGDAYAIPGYFASITRYYQESGEFYDQAVQIQPNHWEAHLELGQNHLRLNRVTPAVDHVRISYEGDPFNPKTINMLRLLDTFLEKFETVSYPNPPVGPFPALVLRLDRNETAIINNYAKELAEDSIAVFTERYRFEPKETITVEIFPNHEDFVVRSIGMPGVGILGVTFGYLFAMDSPSGHPEASYHWGTTLWHEMAHVFTLEATNHAVPRWFSEGISVYEEWQTGPIPGRKIPNNVLQAMSEGKFLPISKLDDGFMRPTYDGQVIVSYMQAGLVFEFIDLEYGFDKIVDILYQFDDGIGPVEAIETSLGITADDFDRHFKQFIDIEYGQMLGQMPVWQQDHQASFAALQEENWEEAIAAADRAIFVYPDYVEIDSPYIAKARAYARLEDEDNEFATLETFWQKGGYEPRALMALAEDYVERGQQQEALEVYKDVSYADPFIEELHVELGDLHMDMNNPEAALAEYLVLLALDPFDKAAANYRLASAYRALNNSDKTMEYLMTALDIAPQYRPAQAMLLDLARNPITPAESPETEASVPQSSFNTEALTPN